ncbi:FixH family protein [Bacillus sp. NPDC077027]|uniref:FixH family protein n=1 Tax=Bacillus sp. NPDC077027 TaxID=3390548 RepID=UPI003D07E71D
MMIKKVGALGFLVLLLTACQLHPNTEDLYEKSRPIQVDTKIPSNIALEKEQTLRFILKEDGKPVTDGADITVYLWRFQDERKSISMKAAHQGNGTYAVKYTFSQDGLYDIKVDVRIGDQHLMPTKRVAIGELTSEEKLALEDKTREKKETHSHH